MRAHEFHMSFERCRPPLVMHKDRPMGPDNPSRDDPLVKVEFFRGEMFEVRDVVMRGGDIIIKVARR